MKKLTKIELGLLVVVIIHILILLNSIFLPYPELFIYPYLTNIGLAPYAQILDQHFPGIMFFPINLANLGFTTPDRFRLLQIAIVIFVHLMLNKIAFKISNSARLALVANLLFLLFHPFLEGGVLWIDNFLPLLLLPLFYLLTNVLTKKKAFIVGVLIASTVLLKQVAIVLAIILAFYILFFRKKEQVSIVFVSGVFVITGILVLYVFQKNILNDFIYWTGTFNLTTYARMGRKYATFREFLAIGVVYIPALLVSVYGLLSRRKTLCLLSVFFITGLLYSYARFDYVHLQPSLPFAILLLISAFRVTPKKTLESVFILYLIPVVWVSSRFYSTSFKNEVRFFGNSEYKVADKVSELTNENDPIFMFGTLPHMYQMTKTRPPGDVFVFQFPWFMSVAEARVLDGLKVDPPKVVVQQKSASIDNSSLFEYMKGIEEYISENYEKIDEVEDIEILIPNESRN